MAGSKKETVRIPEDLAKTIERDYVDTGLFLSKADFVSTAIRFYYENSIRQFGKSKTDSDAKDGLSQRVLIRAILVDPEYLDEMNKYGGEKRSVLLRLPPEFIAGYQRLILETGFYRSKADFFNNALGAYLVFQSNFGSMTENFYKQSARKLPRPYLGENDTFDRIGVLADVSIPSDKDVDSPRGD